MQDGKEKDELKVRSRDGPGGRPASAPRVITTDRIFGWLVPCPCRRSAHFGVSVYDSTRGLVPCSVFRPLCHVNKTLPWKKRRLGQAPLYPVWTRR